METTILENKSRNKDKNYICYRTTIPKNLVKEKNLKQGDKISWKDKGDYLEVKKSES
jgi:bifunctional DNA-binding transcriptional regulator/antitoxin component of YhaV-PrlF toxin-antitoxin module